jgi:uncharacterized protein DUF1629
MVYQLVHGKTPSAEAASLTDYLINVDGDYKKVVIADTSPDGGRPIGNNQLNAGRPIAPDFVPTHVKRQRPLKHPLADYMSAPKGASYVSGAFKDLVERFEPGVHQFFEMKVTSRKQELDTMYLFIVCNRLDSLDHDACVPPILPGDVLYNPTYGPSDKRVFSQRQIGGAHIWCDMHELGIWMSNAFAHAVFETGLTGVKKTSHYDELD